jgi:hypothetical protein
MSEPDDVRVTQVQFDGHEGADRWRRLKTGEDLDARNYEPLGNTPRLDAIGP